MKDKPLFFFKVYIRVIERNGDIARVLGVNASDLTQEDKQFLITLAGEVYKFLAALIDLDKCSNPDEMARLAHECGVRHACYSAKRFSVNVFISIGILNINILLKTICIRLKT